MIENLIERLGNVSSQIITMDMDNRSILCSWTIELINLKEFCGQDSDLNVAAQIASTKTIDFLKVLAHTCISKDEIPKIIFNSVLTQWKALPNPDPKFKIIAAFVVTSDRNPSDVRVLSIGTGSKWISGEYISNTGEVVHDSHAEIIARRALLCHLYENLEILAQNGGQDNQDDLILEPVGNGGKGFRLKSHLKLHLYITSPCCGDARIFQHNVTFSNSLLLNLLITLIICSYLMSSITVNEAFCEPKWKK